MVWKSIHYRFYAVMLVLVALPNLTTNIQNILMLVCGAFLLLSFLLYINEYVKMYRALDKNEEIMDGVK